MIITLYIRNILFARIDKDRAHKALFVSLCLIFRFECLDYMIYLQIFEKYFLKNIRTKSDYKSSRKVLELFLK